MAVCGRASGGDRPASCLPIQLGVYSLKKSRACLRVGQAFGLSLPDPPLWSWPRALCALPGAFSLASHSQTFLMWAQTS